MATRVQWRRGNTAQTAVFTGAAGEITVNTDTNVVVVHDGITPGGYSSTTILFTQDAYDKANSANLLAQQAYDAANAAGSSATVTAAFDKANGAYDQANTALVLAQNAYNTANGANGLAAGAFNTANTNATNITIIQGVDTTQNTNITAVNNYAASAYNQANTNATNITIIQGVDLAQNTSITAVNNYAVSAYAQANTNVGEINIIQGVNNTQNTTIIAVNNFTQSAYNEANTAYSYTTQVQAIADAAYLKANGAYDTANAVNGYAVSAFSTANGANGLAAGAYDTANGANGLAQGAYNTANTNSGNITIIQGVDLTQNTRLNSIETVNVDQNTSIGIIQGVDNTQNTRLQSIEIVNAGQNTAISIIQGVDTWQNTQITAVNNYAASAYNKANTGGTFTGSVIINQDLVVSGNVTFLGNVTSQGATDLIIDDPIIYVANNNLGNSVDIGLVGNFNEAPTGYQHTGIIRQASSNQWKLFSNVASEPTTTVDFTNAIWDDLQLGTLYGNVVAQTVVVNGIDFTASQSTQNTNITAVNNYAASAYAQANTNAGHIVVINGVNATQNNRLNSIETINTNQNTAITIIQGVDLGQNTRMSIIEGVNATQNTRLNSIETINSTQNTSITAVNNYAAGAFARANNSVLKSGDTMTGSLTGVTTLGATTISLAQVDATSNTFTTASVAQVSIDAWPTATYRSAKYFVQITSGAAYHIIELNLVHNGTTVFLTQYGEVLTGASLGTFDADISGATVRVLFTGTNAVSTVKVLRTVVDV